MVVNCTYNERRGSVYDIQVKSITQHIHSAHASLYMMYLFASRTITKHGFNDRSDNKLCKKQEGQDGPGSLT